MIYYGHRGLIVGVLVARVVLAPNADHGSIYLFLVPVVLAVSALGGTIPGFVATCLCVAAEIWRLSAAGLSRANIVDAAAFLAIGLGIAWLGGRVLWARQSAEATNLDLVVRARPI